MQNKSDIKIYIVPFSQFYYRCLSWLLQKIAKFFADFNI